MKTLRETTALLHRTVSPAEALPAGDLRRVLRWTIGLARDLERLHREGRWHGAVGPDVVRIRGDRARLNPPGRTPAPVAVAAHQGDPNVASLPPGGSLPNHRGRGVDSGASHGK